MDEHMGKRADAGVCFSRRGSSLSFRDPDHEDRSIQCCNRLGCSTRLNFIKGTQIGNPEKAKYSRASFRPMSHNAIAESSSKSFSASSDYRKSHHAQQKQKFLQEASITESSSRQVEVEDLECSSREGEIEDSKSNWETEDLESIPTTTGIQTPEPEDLESMNATESLGSCTITSNSRPCKQINRWSRSGNQDASSSSSVRHTIASRNTGQVSRTLSLGLSAGAQRYGLKNLSCRSISDVLPSGCSSSDSGHTRRGDSVRKRFSDGKSSSVRGKDTSGSSSGGDSGSPHSCLSGPNLSIPERIMAQQASRKTRDRSTSRDGIVSVRTRRAPNVDPRIRLSEHEGDETLSLPETTIIPQLPQTQFSILETTSGSSSPSITRELHPIHHNTFGRPSSSSQTARSRPVSHPEDNSTQRFHGHLGDRDGYRRFNMEGIAEVLLALERIEQDDELTYEQLLVLETNLFVGGLSSHDQHRDMRLDVDNMSYEELLALEEKMGTVSTALTEEALSKCLKRSIYTSAFPTSGITGCGDDDIKCSICQEEYAVEDEVGKLACKHRYHLACIHQWLRQKNWCPICKASASPS